MEARPGESAFCLRAGEDWPHGEGWLWAFALRWLGPARRLAAPDSVVVVFSGAASEARLLAADEVMGLLELAESVASHADGAATPSELTAARRVAQQLLRERLEGRDVGARSAAGLSLLLLARVWT
jgi:hypothetical protein